MILPKLLPALAKPIKRLFSATGTQRINISDIAGQTKPYIYLKE